LTLSSQLHFSEQIRIMRVRLSAMGVS